MDLYHNSQSPECRLPLGAQPTGTEVRLRLYSAASAKRVTLRTWNGDTHEYPMRQVGVSGWETSILLPDAPCTLWYDFCAEDERGRRQYYGNAADRLGGVGSTYLDSPPSFQITVYDAAFDPPEYLRRGIMYQIFPDRFARSKPPQSDRTDLSLHHNWEDLPWVPYEILPGADNQPVDFFGGDLQGIRDKLGYLKDLGISVLYLNPIFQARSNHRYDTGDYTKVDPMLGTNEAFTDLCREAQAQGIHVILDGVFSHTGEDSLYFNRYGRYPSRGAYQSRDSKYYPWYRFLRWPDKYACWWDIPTLPEVNKDCPSFREFILGREGIARRWISLGAAGWRLDVADELPMDFLRELRRAVKAQRPDATLLGEVWEDASNKVAYGHLRSYCLGDTVDSVMNYPLRDVLIRFFTGRADAQQVVRLVRSQQENYPAKFLYSTMNLLGSHDRARILNMLVEREYQELPQRDRGHQRLPHNLKMLARERLKKAMQVLIALPGMPALYYGDEAGMEGSSDPFCRGTFPWGKEDRELVEFIRQQFALRRSRPVLQVGTFNIAAEGDDTLLISRGTDDRGLDAFGQPLSDAPFLLRVTRDGERI